MKVLVWLFLIAGLLPSFAAVTVTFEISRARLDSQPPFHLNEYDWPAVTYETSRLEVTLGENAILIAGDMTYKLWDLERHLIFSGSSDEGWEEVERIADILKQRKIHMNSWTAFLQPELEKIPRKLDHDRPPLECILEEHNESLAYHQKLFSPQRLATPSEVIYSFGDQHLLTHSREFLPLEPKWRQKFYQFFRLYFKGHPEILRQLEDAEGIPREMVLAQPKIFQLQTRIKLVDLTQQKDMVYPSTDLTLPEGTHPKLRQLLEEAETYGVSDYNAQLEDLEKSAAKHLAAKAYLAAGALFWEIDLMRGNPDDGLIKKHEQLLKKDPRVRFVLERPYPTTKVEWHQQLETLQKISDEVSSFSPMGDVLVGSFYQTIYEYKPLEKALINGLFHNPVHAGFYFELGGYYDMVGESILAWLCHEASRNLAPSFPYWRSLAAFEAMLMEDHPEYFGK